MIYNIKYKLTFNFAWGTTDLPQPKKFVDRSFSLLRLSWKVIPTWGSRNLCRSCGVRHRRDVDNFSLGKLAFVDRGTVLNLYFVNYSHGEFFGLSNINHSSCMVVIAIDVVSK